jgi:hypothetical protein
VQHIDFVAYKLDLPSTSPVHPVFHMPQLKRASPKHMVSATLPTAFVALQTSVQVLDTRTIM